MALAGLYEYWRDPAVKQDDDPAAWLMTCTIITTEATDTTGRVHPRMPLALTPEHYDTWLDPAHQDPDELRALLGQPADGRLDARPVSTAVNNVRNKGPQLLEMNWPPRACPPLHASRKRLRPESERVGGGYRPWGPSVQPLALNN